MIYLKSKNDINRFIDLFQSKLAIKINRAAQNIIKKTEKQKNRDEIYTDLIQASHKYVYICEHGFLGNEISIKNYQNGIIYYNITHKTREANNKHFLKNIVIVVYRINIKDYPVKYIQQTIITLDFSKDNIEIDSSLKKFFKRKNLSPLKNLSKLLVKYLDDQIKYKLFEKYIQNRKKIYPYVAKSI